MTELDQLIEANRAAVEDLVAAAERAEANWTTPRAPGKWSPQQVVEHVAMAYEEGGNVIAGRPSKLPSLPFFLRPVARSLIFRRVLKRGRFSNAKTNRDMNPTTGPSSPADARRRLTGALSRFEEECRARAASGETVRSGAFGTISVEDYARFAELHTRHHTEQIPAEA